MIKVLLEHKLHNQEWYFVQRYPKTEILSNARVTYVRTLLLCALFQTTTSTVTMQSPAPRHAYNFPIDNFEIQANADSSMSQASRNNSQSHLYNLPLRSTPLSPARTSSPYSECSLTRYSTPMPSSESSFCPPDQWYHRGRGIAVISQTTITPSICAESDCNESMTHSLFAIVRPENQHLQSILVASSAKPPQMTLGNIGMPHISRSNMKIGF